MSATSTSNTDRTSLQVPLDELINSLHLRLEQLQSWLQCRNLTITEEDKQELLEIERKITNLERITTEMDGIVSNEENSLTYIENLLGFVAVTSKHLTHMRECLPSQLPNITQSQRTPSHTLSMLIALYQSQSQTQSQSQPQHQKTQLRTAAPNPIGSGFEQSTKRRRLNVNQARNDNHNQSQSHNNNNNHNIPQLCLVGNNEIESVPKYVRGRLTQKRLNDSITEFNTILNRKYHLLTMNPSKMNSKQMELYDKYKKSETAQTKQEHWLSLQDFKDVHSKLVTCDQTGRAIFNVLRHLKRIKMIAGKTPKYVVK